MYTGEWDHETQLKDMPKRTYREFLSSHRPSKMHLFDLPVCEDDLRWQGHSETMCVVIPVFSVSHNTTSIADYILQSAIWSLRCWQQNTEAKMFDVPIYLYVEDTVIEENAAILLKNGVIGESVLSFTNRGYQHTGKKINAFVDPQLSKYKHVFISDVDLFPLRGEDIPHPFFSIFMEKESDLEGMGVLCSEPITQPLMDSRAAYWVAGKQYPQSWQATVKDVCEPSLADAVINTYEKGSVWIYPWAPLYHFSPSCLTQGGRETLNTLATSVPDDEFVVSLFHEITKAELYPMDARLNLGVIHDLISSRFMVYVINGLLKKRHPVLLHASNSVDFYFQNLIGVHNKV